MIMDNVLQNILITKKSEGYELLDSGDGEKLERYGKAVLVRPDPQALWPKSFPEWNLEDISAIFERVGTQGKWKILKEISEPWTIKLEGINFKLKLLPSKHIGVFPEQSAQWGWLEQKLKVESRKLKVLNLFGYTGGATMACLKAGAEVTHVDASEFAVGLAKENCALSGLSQKPVRFILDDARKFVEREIKRGKKYEVILLDPPVYGKGNLKGKQKEIWKIEKNLMPLLFCLKSILSKEPLAIMLNGYASDYSHITYAQMLETITKDMGGKVASGEYTIKESSSGRLLPSGIFARWAKSL